MTTPVLSKKQQKRSLSGRQTPAKGLRNVLAQPYEFSWPIVRNDGKNELKVLLQILMPAVRRPSLNISWAHLHKLKKMERQVARKEARLKLNIPSPDENILNSIVLGVNGVTRLLEKNDASCVLLEANLEPMLLVKHIITMAELRSVAVILVPFLKSVTLETIGFASAAVALRMTVAETEGHHFHELYKNVVQLAAEFETSRAIKLDLKPSVENISIAEDAPFDSKNIPDKLKTQSENTSTLSTDVYKYRNSKKERVFVPESVRGFEIITPKSDGHFISIGKTLSCAVEEDTHRKYKTKTRYVNIHEKDENSAQVNDDSMQIGEEIYLHSNPQIPESADAQASTMDTEFFYKTKSKILKIDKKSDLNFGVNKINKKNKKCNKNLEYKSLKVARLQGNCNRLKATKVPKKNKK